MSSAPSPSPSPPQYRRSKFLIGLVVIVVAILIGVIDWRSAESTPFDASQETENRTDSTDAGGSSPPSHSPLEPSVEPLPDLALKQILDDYMVPGRMVFFTVHMNNSGNIILEQAQGAAGRAKPSPLRNMPGWIRVDALDANDQLTYSETVEDPTRRFLEHPTNNDDGSMTRTIVEQASGSLFVRVPGESQATRLVLSRWNPDVATGTSPWQPFTSIEFPP